MSKAFNILILSLAFAVASRSLNALEDTAGRPAEEARSPTATNETPSPAPKEGPRPAASISGDPWLDAVRAQRRAWEERRQANRDFLDGYRPSGPRVSGYGDSHHEEYQRRREALRERIARDRELFFNQVPWQTVPTPEPPKGEGETNNPAAPPLPPPPYPPLPGWDNRWYYRGY